MDEKQEVYACLRCGHKIEPEKRRGLVFALTRFRFPVFPQPCPNCGFQGEPIIFDSEKEYNLFLKGFELDKKAQKKD